jgi:hypothetical protein
LSEEFIELFKKIKDYIVKTYGIVLDKLGEIFVKNPVQPDESDPAYGKDYSYYYILKLGETVHGAIKYEHSETMLDIRNEPPKTLVLDLITDKDFVIADGTPSYPLIVKSIDDLSTLKT